MTTMHTPDMYALTLPLGVRRALEDLYVTFAIYHEEMVLAKRPVWMSRKTAKRCRQKELRALTREDLELVFQDSRLASMEDELDALWVRSLLPRQFELLLDVDPDTGEVEVDPSDAEDFLPHLVKVGWELWSQREQDCIVTALMALWEFALNRVVYEGSVLDFFVLLLTIGVDEGPFVRLLSEPPTPQKALTIVGLFGGHNAYLSPTGWKARQCWECDYDGVPFEKLQRLFERLPLTMCQEAVRIAKGAIKSTPSLLEDIQHEHLHRMKRFFKRLKLS